MSDLKQKLRDIALKRRAEASKTIADDFGLLLTESYMDLIAQMPLGPVAGYWPIGDEADPRMLMMRLAGIGNPLLLPAIVEKDHPLDFRYWQPGDDLEEGAHGTQHPPVFAGSRRPVVVLVPLLVFDGKGNRLGWGGGYYDRTLKSLRKSPELGPLQAVGVAFSTQEVEAVPNEGHDEPLDWVITEREARRFR